MNENTGQLSESFSAHEHLAPDASDVLARANEIARAYQRRRWAVRATATAALTAGVVAGGVAIPGLVGHSSKQTITPASDGASPAPSTDPASYTPSQEMDAFFSSGYTYEDAQQLAQLWKDDRTITKVKAAAGLKLLEGEKLPIPPSGTPATSEDRGVSAFFAAGYSYDDAVTLAGMWHETDVYQVKAEAGDKLLDGESLPIQPSAASGDASGASGAPTPASIKVMRARALELKKVGSAAGGAESTDPKTDADYQAYAAAGYTYEDALALGKVWNETDVSQIKAEAGQKLIDGDTLPVQPSGQPESQQNKAVDAFFNAGYDYDDAVTLAGMWHETDVYQVKAEAGQKLLDGQTLPIKP
jgi:hypothetical protein